MKLSLQNGIICYKQIIIKQLLPMHCRIPTRFKRYMTEPNDFQQEHRTKYNNLTLQEIKLQLNPFEPLNQIKVPSVSNNRVNIQRTPKNLTHLQQKYYLHTNTNKKSKDIRLPPHNRNNGYEMPQTCKVQLPFKKNNPLFVVNTLIDILKDDYKQSASVSVPKNNNYRNKEPQNQFNEFEGKSVKIQRAPRLVQNQMNRLTQQSNYSRRRIYSEEKSRQKEVGQVQLLTFYKPKKAITLNSVQKLS